MDLKTYAVHRKLRYDDNLLSYVVNGEPIPVSVIEASFQGFIAPIEDKKSEKLIENYKEMLASEVPVVVSKNRETGGYEVTGDIPDTLVDAIMTVHHITQDEVVSALVDYNLETVHGQSCRIVGTSLTEQAERTMINAMSIPDVVSVSELMEDRPHSVVSEPSYIASTPTSDEISDVLESMTEMEPAEGDIEHFEVDEGTLDDMASDVLDSLAAIEDEASDAEAMDGYDTDQFDDGVVADEDPIEDPVEEFVDEDEDASMAAAIRRIYDKLCADIRAYGLDTRLNLTM